MEVDWIWQLALWNRKNQLHLSALQDCDTTEEWKDVKKEEKNFFGWRQVQGCKGIHPWHPEAELCWKDTAAECLPAGLAVVRRVVRLFPVPANVPLADHAPLGTDQGVLHLQRSSHGPPGTQP